MITAILKCFRPRALLSALGDTRLQRALVDFASQSRPFQGKHARLAIRGRRTRVCLCAELGGLVAVWMQPPARSGAYQDGCIASVFSLFLDAAAPPGFYLFVRQVQQG